MTLWVLKTKITRKTHMRKENVTHVSQNVLTAFFATLLAMMSPHITASAQDDYPLIAPTATYTEYDGTEETTADKSGSAPLRGVFCANATNSEGWTSNYEWRFTKENSNEPYLIRYEENTEVLFTEYGTTSIVCYATFVNGNDSIVYGKEYWEQEAMPLRVSIAASKLEMPNAFSPNGDGINDIYKAKSGWKSIVEFKATIYNRYGQKIFEWTNPEEGWDGTHKGTPVKDGVYYCQVKALGADGIRYNIRRDVNILRGYIESSTSTEQ